jgi:hypothetical protein
MPKESKGEVGLATHAGEAGVQGPPQRGQLRGAHIGQFAHLDVAPHLFDRVQFRGVPRQAFDVQPAALASQIRAHGTAPVRTQAVPDQDHWTTAEVPFQVAQKPDEGPGRIGAGTRLEIEAGPPPIPAEGQRPGYREPLPGTARVDQDRGVAARRPGAADNGLLRDPAFVLEDEPGPPAPGVFFTVGQRAVTQCRMAASSRSRAWRVGRCNDHCSPRRMYQT